MSRKKFLRWDALLTDSSSLDEMRKEVDELRALVNTLLTIIMEEADGVQSGTAQTIPNLPRTGYSM